MFIKPQDNLYKHKKRAPKGSFKWRRIWDSNPGDTRMPDGFQDRSNQPLWHSSKVIQLVTESILHKTKLIVKRFVKIFLDSCFLLNIMLKLFLKGFENVRLLERYTDG